jgi:cob(I)alamin adenosyltransferase
VKNKRDMGLIHVYCGEGKGKTTAAVGLITRACGHGFRVLLVQFLKSGQSGELKTLSKMENVQILAGQVTSKFSIAMNEEEKRKTRDLHLNYFRTACRRVTQESIDVLVLDEVLGAIESGLMDEGELVDFLRHKPLDLEVVLTGRQASEEIFALADYISRIECVRHPYQHGILARRGIEY